MIVTNPKVYGTVDLRGFLILNAHTFSQLPASPRAGMVVYISDATQNTPNSAVTSGGSTNKILAWYNGAQWTCIVA
jgi:hypothetical protein